MQSQSIDYQLFTKNQSNIQYPLSKVQYKSQTMKNLHIYSFIVFILFLTSCREDPFEPQLYGSVVGVVLLDGDENIAIANAQVTTNPATNSIVTDSLGQFSLDSIAVNTYTLRIEKKGFNTELEGISVNEGRTSNVIIRLRPDSLDNTPPAAPFSPMPLDGEKELSTSLTLSWEGMDSDNNDELRYEVKLFNADQTQSEVVLNKSLDNFVTLEGLRYNSIYFWQVIADDGQDRVNSPVWSFQTKKFPDNRFLYVREGNGVYNIFSSDVDGNEVQLTASTSSCWRPKMNPNRTQIAYISNTGIEQHIYRMNRDGSNPTKITQIPISGFNNLELDYAWSPDGSKILYMNTNKLYTINADGTGLKFIANAPQGYAFTTCDWTPQGEAIVVRTTGTFNHNSEIHILNADGVYLERIASDVAGSTGGAEFSIDGNHLLYTQDDSGFEVADGRQLDSNVYLFDLTTLTRRKISTYKEAGTNDLDPHFSPDGSKVIFVNTNNDGISPKNIYIMDLDDGGSRTLLFEDAQMPSWQ